MAAITFTSGDQIDRVTCNATPGTSQELIFPKNTRTVTIQCFDAAGTSFIAGKVAITGADATSIGADYWTIPAGAAIEISMEKARTRRDGGFSLFIASAVASGIIEVWASKVGA